MPKTDYSSWEKEDLIKKIKALERRKKYGLVWDAAKEPEKVVLDCREELPVLKEDKTKEIITNPNQPTHILIEGDNYHALSVLNYTHNKAIDVIYIDPPYNTGSGEFIYNDNIVVGDDAYRHSKWLSFMEKRLHLAKDLLRNSGAIFISIDDNEYTQLKLLCDEIFKQQNYVGTLIWEKKKKGSHLDLSIINIKEYILVYCRNRTKFNGLIGQTAKETETYPCINTGNAVTTRVIPKGIKSNYKQKNFILKAGSVITEGNMKMALKSDLSIREGFLAEDVLIESEWRYNQDLLIDLAKRGLLYITTKLYIRRIVNTPREKKLKDILPRVDRDYLLDLKDSLIKEYESKIPDNDTIITLKHKIAEAENLNLTNINVDNLTADGWGSNEDGDNELRDFFGKKVFDYPKPTRLITKLILSTRIKDATILDFMAGTGTTAHAVLRSNELDGGNRQFIMCTNNEAAICETICYPRISKTIKGYQDRNGKTNLGLGGNLKYYVTSFVPAAPTDKNKELLTKQSIEMLTLKEGTFEKVTDNPSYVIYRNSDKYTGIIFDQLSFAEFKKAVATVNKPISLYIFSFADDDFSDDFAGMRGLIKICAIPESILRVYRRIFR